MLEPSTSPNFYKIKNDINDLSTIAPNTFVRKSTTTNRFIPTAGGYSYLPGVQSVANFYKGHTPENTAIDIEVFAREAIKEIKDLNESITKTSNLEKRKIIFNNVKELNTAFQEAKPGRVKDGGINGIIETYKSYKGVSERITDAFCKLENFAKLAMTHCKLVVDLDSLEDKKYDERSFPEEEYSDKRWELEMENSHKLQKEVTSSLKYHAYNATLNLNMFKNITTLFTTDLQKLIFGQDYEPGWDWWNKIGHFEKGDLFLGALPLSAIGGRDDLQAIKEEGVQAVLSVVEVFENGTEGSIVSPITPEMWKNADVNQLQLPTPDFKSIPMDKVMRGVEFIHWNLKNGRSVYTHCKAGRGRSALIVMCYLIKYHNMSALEAFTSVQGKRTQAGFGTSSDKMATLLKFEKLIKSTKK